MAKFLAQQAAEKKRKEEAEAHAKKTEAQPIRKRPAAQRASTQGAQEKRRRVGRSSERGCNPPLSALMVWPYPRSLLDKAPAVGDVFGGSDDETDRSRRQEPPATASSHREKPSTTNPAPRVAAASSCSRTPTGADAEPPSDRKDQLFQEVLAKAKALKAQLAASKAPPSDAPTPPVAPVPLGTSGVAPPQTQFVGVSTPLPVGPRLLCRPPFPPSWADGCLTCILNGLFISDTGTGRVCRPCDRKGRLWYQTVRGKE